MLDTDAAVGLRVVGDEAARIASSQVVPVTGQPFTQAMRVDVREAGSRPWSVLLVTRPNSAVRKGDVLLLSFYVRCAASMTGEMTAGAQLERNSGDWHKVLELPVGARDAWARIDIPGVADLDLPAGESQVSIHLGHQRQSVEIGGLTLTNFGPNGDVKSLPRTRFSYDGRELDATWRADAARRIDEFRKADLTVHVVDANGAGVPGAAVHVRMKRHAFPFGTAVVVEEILGSEPQNAQYREKLVELFNAAVFENDMKWPALDQPGGPERALRALDWLDSQGIVTRGHVLVWPNFEWNPEWLRALSGDPEKLRTIVGDHVTTTASRFAGRITDWDVLNEPFTNRDFATILGEGEYARWFNLSKSADPSAKRFINDFGILKGNAMDRAHIDHYEQTIRTLIDQGAPLDGIGFQGHFGYLLTSPDVLLKTLDRFAVFGKEMKITELDVNVDDPQLQADYLRDFLTVCFSHRQVTGVTQWGFWAPRHWRPRAALFDADFTPRPAAIAYRDLIFKTWWTDLTVTTDAQGTAVVRGFLGDYEITTPRANGKLRQLTTLDARGTSVTLQP